MSDAVRAAREWLANEAAQEWLANASLLGWPLEVHKRIVLAEQGCGDTARAITLCGAISKTCAGGGRVITLISHYDGTMAKRDMAEYAMRCGFIGDYVEAPTPGGVRLERGELLAALLPHCDVLYDAMSPVVKTYYRDNPAAQALADSRLAPYGAIYAGYPFDSWRLWHVRRSWADLMAATTGLDVRAKDLACAAPLECAPLPPAAAVPPGGSIEDLAASSGLAELPAFTEARPYVVVHRGAGGDGRNKTMPRAVANAIIARLQGAGFPCVQVGMKGEESLPTQWKMLGLRLPLTNRLIKGALCLVDNEGFLPHMAKGLDVPAAVLFSVTPYEVYSLEGNLNVPPGLSAYRKEELPRDLSPAHLKALVGAPRQCPHATCFWGGGWTWPQNAQRECRLSMPMYNLHTPCPGECMNFPRPDDAARIVAEWVQKLAAEKRGADAA